MPALTEISSTIARWRAVAVLAILACAVVWSLAVLLLRGDAAIDEQQLTQLAQQLDQRAAGRIVVIHPPWRDDVASALRQLRPQLDVRLAAPVQAGLPTGALALVRIGWSPGPGAFSTLTPSDRFAVGAAAVELFGSTAPAVASGGGSSLLLADVTALRVQVEVGGRTVLCNDLDPAGPTHRCPSLPEWNHVGPQDLIIGGQARRCLWAHPITGGRIVIDAPWPLATQRIKLFYGLADTAVGAPDGQPVTLDVYAGERKLGTFVQPNQPGYNEQTVALGEPASDRLRFTVSTPHDGARHFCLDAVAERGPTPIAPVTRPAALSQPAAPSQPAALSQPAAASKPAAGSSQ